LELDDQRLRVSEILRGNCQLEELIAWRKYAVEVLCFVFFVVGVCSLFMADFALSVQSYME
jgi:hypothetical protein